MTSKQSSNYGKGEGLEVGGWSQRKMLSVSRPVK